ncbi:MAG TPA: CRTAC1 family protein [Bryobacteraceae bacterium]|nr:CRTAC1 family protein [Bryobacteraceae bacterium]
MTMTRRRLIRSLSGAAAVFTLDQLTRAAEAWDVRFSNIARDAGLTQKTIFGGEKKNRYLVETTGCGVAFFDYDNDGWLDIFFVNGTRFESVTPAPSNRLFKNNRDGTFTDVTVKAGLVRTGWGQGVCVGDFDNDGNDDLFISYWGENALYRNNGDGTFSDVSKKAGITTAGPGLPRWNTGCAFVDYDRDGWLDLFVANYIDFDRKTAPVPESGTCLYKGLKVACGPPGLPGGKNILFRNNRDGTFKDVSKQAGILNTPGTYSLGVLVGDFDNDGWPDIYVANDSTSSALYRNNQDGTFTEVGIEAGVAYSADGKSQAGMGVSAADYDGDGWLDIVKTNFAGDTSSLYRNSGKSVFEDQTFQAGLGRNTRFLGWGAAFADFDNEGHPDILLANGHVYPEVGDSDVEAGYRQRKVLYRNTGKGRFEDVSMAAGAGITETASARGLALGDFDNDGDLDAVINCVNDIPQLLRCDVSGTNRWLKVKCIGTKSNRTGIGARVVCSTADGTHRIDEVRSGGSYLSQSDLRLHFGLGQHDAADLEVRWPSGLVENWSAVKANQIVRLTEGSGTKK